MRIPDASSSSLGLALQVPLLQILLTSFALDFFELCPSGTQELRGQVDTSNFGTSEISGDIVIGWKRVNGGERDFFADCEGTEELPRLVSPGLEKIVSLYYQGNSNLIFTSSSRRDVPGRGAWRSAR